MATTTPWGKSQEAIRIARGIMWYTTAGHGGYHLSKKRLSEMPEPYKSFKTFAGKGWYEEDCDWAVVHLCFGKELQKYYGETSYEMHLAQAIRTLEAYREYFTKRGIK